MSNYIIQNGELCHYGVKGQRWGVRRYQNPDGTLTDAGKKRNLTTAKKIASVDSEIKKDEYAERNEYIRSARERLRETRNAHEKSVNKLNEYIDELGRNFDRNSEFSKRINTEIEKMHDERVRKYGPDSVNDDYAADFYEEAYRRAIKSDAKYKTLKNEFDATYESYRESVKKEVDGLLGKYGDTMIGYSTARDHITRRLLPMYY